MKSILSLLVLLLVFSNQSYSATCVSLGDGAWADPSNWSCGAVPVAGDVITIDVGHTVTISANTNMTGAATTIYIDGTLEFNAPGAKLRLGCGSVIYLSATGSITSTGVGQPSHSIRICGSEVWNGKNGTLTGPLVIGTPLPVELAYFEAKINGLNIDFNWQTATEINNDFFTVEGSSDGFSWNELVEVDGFGSTQEVQNYSAVYNNRSEGFAYFRLKQTDLNGDFTFSDIVSIEQQDFGSLVIFPNPSNGENLNLSLPYSSEAEVMIYDSKGQLVSNSSYSDVNRVDLSSLTLTNGLYLVQVEQEGELFRERLVID